MTIEWGPDGGEQLGRQLPGRRALQTGETPSSESISGVCKQNQEARVAEAQGAKGKAIGETVIEVNVLGVRQWQIT